MSAVCSPSHVSSPFSRLWSQVLSGVTQSLVLHRVPLARPLKISLKVLVVMFQLKVFIKVNFQVLHLKDITIVTNAQCTQLSSKVLPLQDQNSFYTIYDPLDHSLWEWLQESRGN